MKRSRQPCFSTRFACSVPLILIRSPYVVDAIIQRLFDQKISWNCHFQLEVVAKPLNQIKRGSKNSWKCQARIKTGANYILMALKFRCKNSTFFSQKVDVANYNYYAVTAKCHCSRLALSLSHARTQRESAMVPKIAILWSYKNCSAK